MALTKTEHLYEFMARVGTGEVNTGRVVGMQVTYLDRVLDGAVTVIERTGRTAPVDYAGLAALMHDDDLAALKIAVDAEIASRA